MSPVSSLRDLAPTLTPHSPESALPEAGETQVRIPGPGARITLPRPGPAARPGRLQGSQVSYTGPAQARPGQSGPWMEIVLAPTNKCELGER